MPIIQVSVHPFGAYREEVLVGNIVDGHFSKFGVALKESDLSIKRRYTGAYGKPSSAQHFTIQVPNGYQMAIAKKRVIGQETIQVEEDFEILYTPVS